jgi:transposase-like protein
MTEQPSPRCGRCGRQMRIISSEPRTDKLPERQTFVCSHCGKTLVIEISEGRNESE